MILRDIWQNITKDKILKVDFQAIKNYWVGKFHRKEKIELTQLYFAGLFGIICSFYSANFVPLPFYWKSLNISQPLCFNEKWTFPNCLLRIWDAGIAFGGNLHCIVLVSNTTSRFFAHLFWNHLSCGVRIRKSRHHRGVHRIRSAASILFLAVYSSRAFVDIHP